MLSRRAFGFLALPVLPDKPRSAGITVAIDRGLHLRDAILLADNRPGYVDAVKLGWGTSAIVPEGTLRDKIGAYRAKDIGVMPGGTLMEIAAVEGVYERFLDACGDYGFTHIEVSNGTFDLAGEKPSLIREAKRRGFAVFAEVGRKDSCYTGYESAEVWLVEAMSDLDAGADKIVLEGRESGTCGIYNGDGIVKADIIDLLAREIGPERFIFEAPQKRQQVEMIRRFGNEVNLGNIQPDDVVPLATLRLCLRSDTAKMFREPALRGMQ